MHHANRTKNKVNCTGAQCKHTNILKSYHHKLHLFCALLYTVIEKFPAVALYSLRRKFAIALYSDQICSTFKVVRVTSTQFGLHAGNINFNTQKSIMHKYTYNNVQKFTSFFYNDDKYT